MTSEFLLYGATGYVGEAVARMAAESGLRPILGGRNEASLADQAAALGVDYRVFSLGEPAAIDAALDGVTVVLSCAGPFLYTYRPMVEACLRAGAHYLDLTGEFPVLEGILALDSEARERGVMLLPGVGFDVVPTDCLAVHLKQRLPSATRLTLAFGARGPAGLPPGTQRTMIEMVPYTRRGVRRNGRRDVPVPRGKKRLIDLGTGPTECVIIPWGDVVTASVSTGIADIEVYADFPADVARQLRMLDMMRPLFKLGPVRALAKTTVKPGPSAEARARSSARVWGEVADDEGRTAVSRLQGPEAGLIWTAGAALAAVRRTLAGDAPPGFQTPGGAYGADFVFECEGVTREDVA